MNVGMVSVTFRDKSIREVFEYARAASIEGIEWGICDNHMRLLDNERAREIIELSEKTGIQIFSLGSYCNMDNLDEALQAVETACMLHAPIIRVWAGEKGSQQSSRENRETIVSNTILMAKKAMEYGIKIGFEYHNGTLTDTAESAVKLISEIDMENVGLYWQPSRDISVEDNLREFCTVMPYLIGILHISNYTAKEGYRYLSEIANHIRSYYTDVKDKPYCLLIEFVKDSSLESLMKDARTLKEIVK